MKLEESKTLKEIADFLGCEYIGDSEHKITGFNEIHRVKDGDLVFVDHPKYYDKALNSDATTVLINKNVPCPVGKGLIISDAPFDDFNKLTRHFSPWEIQQDLIHYESKISPTAQIYPNVFIGKNVTIGDHTVLYPGVVVLDNVVIEEHVIIGPNTTIGFNAFYYKHKPSGYVRLHTCGGVKIEKNVEIGASCTIDAGVTETTIIGAGTKIDNHVQIGHDTHIGKNCLFASQVGIAGCVDVKDEVTMWGQAGCTSDVVIGEKSVISAQAGISKDLEGGKTYAGTPAQDIRVKYRELAAIRRLPEILESL